MDNQTLFIFGLVVTFVFGAGILIHTLTSQTLFGDNDSRSEDPSQESDQQS